MPDLKSPTPAERRQSFLDFLDSIDFGHFTVEATQELNDLVHACTETRKAGTLTITLKMKPVGSGAQMEIVPDIKVTKPKIARAMNILFATPDNNLQREDPRQATLKGVRTADDLAPKNVRSITG